jgi:hypothetical protein
VRLHLEGDAHAGRDLHEAGTFTRAEHDPRRLGGKLAQMHPRRFVRAMLGPHDREHRELGVRGIASDDLLDASVFLGRQT